MALDSGKVTLASVFDATSPIKIDRFTINDDHPQRRPLTVPEIFTYSSNIASAKIAADVVGPEAQRAFFDKIGFLKSLKTQVTELGSPLWPRHWVKINAMTIAFGHGLSVTPLHLAIGASAVVNGGMLYSPSFVKRNASSEPGRRVIQAKTSEQMRQLLRLNVVQGTGKNAEVKGYEVGGKTGTAEKVGGGGYRKKALFSTFVGAFPMSEPRFIIVFSLDEPHGIAETGGYATAGMVAAPSVKTIVERIVTLYGILPGDWNGNPASLAIASTPLAASPPPPQLMPASAHGRAQERRALPARVGGPNTAAAGVRRVAVE
jgi:cell division protein FtsI (penicillin-binding protein 3)